jgi:predicted transcriptional regulator of viral defense system
MTASADPKGLGDLERQLLAAITRLERSVVSVDEIRGAMGGRAAFLPQLLARLAEKGWLYRVKRGHYAVVPITAASDGFAIENALAAAMRLFAPCYISGWSAAEHWGITEQIHNAVVVFSAHPQRSAVQRLAGVLYHVRSVRPESIFGTTRIWAGTEAIEMAGLHRTLLDVLDVPALGGGGRQALDIARNYWRHGDAAAEVTLEQALRLGKGAVLKRLGFTTETFATPSSSWIERCRRGLSAGIALLDPDGPNTGHIVTRWRLRINVPMPHDE